MGRRPVERIPEIEAFPASLTIEDLPDVEERVERLVEASGWLRERLAEDDDPDERVRVAALIAVLFDPRIELSRKQQASALALLGPYQEAAGRHVREVVAAIRR